MKLTHPSAALCAGLVALAVAGCGSSNSSSNSSSATTAAPAPTTAAPAPSAGGGSGGSQNLPLAADSSGQLKFDKSALSAKAGNVTITMTNPSPVPHAIAIEGNGLDKAGKTVTTGSKSSITAKLKPGKYTFYCPVDGHRQAGMQGTLTVK